MRIRHSALSAVVSMILISSVAYGQSQDAPDYRFWIKEGSEMLTVVINKNEVKLLLEQYSTYKKDTNDKLSEVHFFFIIHDGTNLPWLGFYIHQEFSEDRTNFTTKLRIFENDNKNEWIFVKEFSVDNVEDEFGKFVKERYNLDLTSK